jgi:hypothetical protein
MLLSISQLQQCLTVGFTFTLGNFLIVYHNIADTHFKFSAFFEVKKIWRIFFIALFLSNFKSSINLEVISELGNHCVRRTRLGQIVSGGYD